MESDLKPLIITYTYMYVLVDYFRIPILLPKDINHFIHCHISNTNNTTMASVKNS